MTLAEAEEAYRRSIRNLSFEQVAEIEKDPGKLDDPNVLFSYARRLRRRIHELKEGVIYSEVGEMVHHPV